MSTERETAGGVFAYLARHFVSERVALAAQTSASAPRALDLTSARWRILGIGGGTTEILTALAAKALGYAA